jgi:hypothetical protein
VKRGKVSPVTYGLGFVLQTKNYTPQMDLKSVADCFGGNTAVLMKTVQRIHDHLPSQWQLLLDHIEAGDVEQISIVSHRMAGTVMMVGAERFSSNLRDLSRFSKSGKIPNSQMVAATFGLYELLMQEIAVVLKRADKANLL